jgi:MFS transporter, PPP family, 3-phenylpropionic acid transporter
VRLGALYAAIFGVFGIALPFFPIWLEQRGLKPDAIAIVLALPMAVRVVASPLLTGLADGPLGPLRLLVLANGLTAVFYAALGSSHSFVAIVMLTTLVAVSQSPILPVTDVLATGLVRAHAGLDYGRIRLWGSVAFLGANLGGGLLLAVIHPARIVWLLAATALIGLALSLAAPVPDNASGPRRVPLDRAGAWPARALWLVIGASALVQASHAMVYAFGSVSWQAAGFGGATIGALWAVGVLAEIVLFATAGFSVGRGVASLRLVVAGGCLAALRFASMSAGPGLAATFVLQALHAGSFAATHLGTMAAISALAPASARSRYQGFLAAGNALVTALATLASGPLYRTFGTAGFLAMAPLGLAGAGLAWLVLKAQPHRAGVAGDTSPPS